MYFIQKAPYNCVNFKAMTKAEFKAQVPNMSEAQSRAWFEIYNNLAHEVNQREYKTKAGYKAARLLYTRML